MKTRLQSGMTLIEAMVAMTISSILIIGSITMYSQARTNYRITESVARMQENLRFSIDILDEDVRLAGYWGRTSGTADFNGIGDVNISCTGDDVRDWVLAPPGQPVLAIEALQDGNALPPECQGTDPRADSDVLIVRRARASDSEPTNGVVQIQSNVRRGAIFDDNGDPGSPAMTAMIDGNQVNDVLFSAYYVSERSKYDATLPALRRLTLVNDQIEDTELIPGVENLQVQFGIDSSGNGQLDMYVNGDEVGTSRIISARLWMLVRAEQNEAGLGYEDNKGPYIPPDGNLPSIDPVGDDAEQYPPTYRRMVMSRTIVLRNTE